MSRTAIAGGFSRLASDFVRSQGLGALIPGRTAGSAARRWVRESAKGQDRQAKARWTEEWMREVHHLVREVGDFLGTFPSDPPR